MRIYRILATNSANLARAAIRSKYADACRPRRFTAVVLEDSISMRIYRILATNSVNPTRVSDQK